MAWLKPITLEEVREVENVEGGVDPAQLLEGIKTGEQLIDVLARAMKYSSAFEIGVMRLASALQVQAIRFDTSKAAFTTLENPWPAIAENVLAAASDEKGHRDLAKKTLDEAIRFFFGNRADKPYLSRVDHEGTNLSINRVLNGYNAEQSITYTGLHMAVGFHLGAETLSVRDFELLVAFLNDKYPRLMDHLKAEGADQWLKLHVGLEPQHAQKALAAANDLMKVEKERPMIAWRRADIMLGVAEFKRVEAAFAASILGAGGGAKKRH